MTSILNYLNKLQSELQQFGEHTDGNNIQIMRNKNTFFGDYKIIIRNDLYCDLINIMKYLENQKAIINVSLMKKIINFNLDPNWKANLICQDIHQHRLISPPKVPKKYVIEFSSPNANKPQHLGHLRNNLLGQSLVNILRYQGHHVNSINLINDRGIHICKSMYAYLTWGKGETPKELGKKGDLLVGDYYVLYENKLEKEYQKFLTTPEAEKIKEFDPTNQSSNDAKKLFFNHYSHIGKETKEMLVKWESSDYDTLKLWQTMTNWAMDGFRDTYALYGISFDIWERESNIYHFGKKIVQENKLFYPLPADDGTIKDQPLVVDLTKLGIRGFKPEVVLRSDGTSLYMTQDIGNLVHRFDKYKADEMIYVVADEQNDHFKKLFAIGEHLLSEKQKTSTLSCNFHHVSYGMITLPDGKMKSRKGNTVEADALHQEVSDLIMEDLIKREEEKPPVYEPTDKVRREIANNMAMAAIKHTLLSIRSKNRLVFDKNKSIQITGDTGPYIMYTYARICQILSKGSYTSVKPIAFASLGSKLENEVINQMIFLGYDLQNAVNSLDPSHIITGIYNLCQAFNKMYHDPAHIIVHTDGKEKSDKDKLLSHERLALCMQLKILIKEMMSLVTIDLSNAI